jgi:hypothetical protein
VLAEGDEKDLVRVQASATDDTSQPVSATSNTLGAVKDVAPTLTTPTISGTAQQGQTLTATAATGTTDDGGVGVGGNSVLGYQWQRSSDGSNWSNITVNGTSSTYTLVAADVNDFVRVEESFTDDTGQNVTAESAASNKVLTSQAPTGFTFTADTATLAALAGSAKTSLTASTQSGSFTETGGIAGDNYSWSITSITTTGTTNAFTIAGSGVNAQGTLSTGSSGASGANGTTLYDMVVKVTDNSNSTSFSSHFEVIVGNLANNAPSISVGSVDGNTTTPTVFYALGGKVETVNASTLSTNVWFYGNNQGNTYTGGSGVNRYLFDAVGESPQGNNAQVTITNFHASASNDIIDLTALGGGTTGVTAFQSTQLTSGSGAGSTLNANSIGWIQSGGNTIVYVNNTSTSGVAQNSAAMKIILSGTLTLTNSNFSYSGHVLPAGISESPINLGLSNPGGDPGQVITLTVSGLPSGWTLSEGTNNGDGSWTVQTSDPSSLYVTTAAGFAGAMVLNVSERWTNADGSAGSASVRDNVEAYPASPIFAVSGDDTLTGGTGGNNEFVFAQPIGNDTIYNFTTGNTIDLIGFGLSGFGALAIADDASGNAVVTLGAGETITLKGVDASALSAANFLFDQEPVSVNSGTMSVGDGAILPLGGTVQNTGVIAINSTGDESDLEIQVRGVTLTGGGQVTLSDNSQNVVFGGDASAVLDNFDNTISGAGQLGQGQLTLHNEGTIAATRTNALVIDTGANAVVNTGTLQASGAGGLVVDSAVTGAGKAQIAGSSSIEFAAASATAVSFDAGASGMLKLDQSATFGGTIAGFTLGDAIDLADLVDGAGATLGYGANSDNTGGTLTIGDAAGTHTVSLALLGQYAAADFVAGGDGHGGTLVTHVDPNQPIIVAHA